jgi:short-subunit dehydrogenase
MKLKDKNVVVVGATGGIGLEITREFAKRRTKLILVARSEEKLKKLSNELGNNVQGYFTVDFTKTSNIENVGKKITDKYKSIDVLINAAGIGVYKNIEEVTLADWEDSFAVNVTAAYFMTKALLPSLKNSKKSVVLSTGSGMGKIPTPGRSVYCATKYALRGVMLSLAQEFKGTNVNIVHVTLGSILTEFGPMTLKEKEEESLKGKAYFTPQWVAKKFADIVEKEEFEDEITLYPSHYSDKDWQVSDKK